MQLRYITCSDPREHNPIKDIIKLGVLPKAEIAVQCHPSKMSDGMPRNVWFKELLHQAYDIQKLNLAIHINNDWANDICVNGKIPDEIINFLGAHNSAKKPAIKRIQINMPVLTADNINPAAVARIIHDFCTREFIFQYNDSTKSAVEKLHQTGAKFSLLFDASGGKGAQPDKWEKPIYETHPMGYAGGISPDNVVDTLRKINAVVPQKRRIWIDAEGRLKSNNLFDEKMKFDIELARSYIIRANSFANQKE